ncbi:MAG: DUF370 domain-containing protein [Oscillospiraceae bacterium]|nr:DUF370 domain-containing protein [Oscillospiraceae bacterium]
MYIHLGNEISISDKRIVGIFDLEGSSLGNDTREYLKKSTAKNQIVNVSMEMPKSFIVCNDNKTGDKVFISPISVTTLHKRADTSI